HIEAATVVVVLVRRNSPLVVRTTAVLAAAAGPRQGREHARTTDFRVQLARGDQQGVADLLRLQATPREGAEQAVLWIGSDQLRAFIRRLPVDAGVDDGAMPLLHVPAAFDETCCQVVEQSRIRRLGARLAKVTQGLDDAATEVLLPYAVDIDACRQRVLLTGEPLDKCAATP